MNKSTLKNTEVGDTSIASYYLEKEKDFFVSKPLQLAFYLTKLDASERARRIGILPSLYGTKSRESAKRWVTNLTKIINPKTDMPQDLRKESLKIIAEFYRSMTCIKEDYLDDEEKFDFGYPYDNS